MRLADAVVSALTATASAVTLPNAFETSDFNLTKALSATGIDITAIPGLAGLVGQSSPKACSIAVSLLKRMIAATRPNIYVEPSVVLFRLPLVTPACYRKAVQHTRTSRAHIGPASKSSSTPFACSSRPLQCKSRLLSWYPDSHNARLP